MIQTNCPDCGAMPAQDEKHLDLVSCGKCGLTWTLLKEDVDTEFHYQDEIYEVVDNRNSIFEKIILREANIVLKGAERLRPDSGRRLLDFGSGKGQFLVAAQGRGWNVLGIETAGERARFAREKYRVEVSNTFYHGGPVAKNRFDLITLNHVMEHLGEPGILLRELLRENLNSDGLVMIEVPRLDSWQSRIAGAQWVHLDIPKHLTHWTSGRLRLFMAKLGFRMVRQRCFSIHLGVLGMLQALLVRTGYRRNIILDLKRQRTFELLLRAGIFLPLAIMLESIALLVGRTGIIGMYFERCE